MRPTNARTKSRSSVKSAPSIKPSVSKKRSSVPELPEDDNDWSPRRGKKRGGDAAKKAGAKKRDKFDKMSVEEIGEVIEELGDESEDEKAPPSIFSKHFGRVQKLMEKGEDVPLEVQSEAFYRATQAMAIDLIPLAESSYRKTQKEGAMYALVALVNKIGELQNDLKMSEDIDGKVATINTLLYTCFVRMANMLVQEKYTLQNSIDGITRNSIERKAIRKEIDNLILSFTKAMDEHKKVLESQVRAFLQGDPNYLNPMAAAEEAEKKAKKKKGKKKSR
ncbi:hypothetical protein EVC12_142 [Rhizobium phage RHph_I42]|nr:hypothetical protein EVC12_142 [Rhizobium phage RHph_I42]